MYQAVHRVPHPVDQPSTSQHKPQHRRKSPFAALTALGLLLAAGAGTLGASQSSRPPAGDLPVPKPLFPLAGHLPAIALDGNVGSMQITSEPPILFVTQPPFPKDFGTVNSVFGSHIGATYATPRGGDLWIRYGPGSLRNLTAEAGYGLAPLQEIAVREPCVHWSGKKALFSMVIGGTNPSDAYTQVYWQIYEVSGIEPGAPVKIVKIPQPTQSNNVSPFYGTDDRVFFTSDLPHNGLAQTFPQLDEYESTATNTGIWSMSRKGTDMKLLDHAVSGAFTPFIASDGRVIFTRWDHLQRDGQNLDGSAPFGAFNYASEESPVKLTTNVEMFPEPLTQSLPWKGHTFNLLLPWQMNEDGTHLETLNHVGRHELLAYIPAAKNTLIDFYVPIGSPKQTINGNLLHIKEDPTSPGTFLATTAPEFDTHAAGQIVSFQAPESLNADDFVIVKLTDPSTELPLADGAPPPANFAGHFRNPVRLSDGQLIAVRTSSPFKDKPLGAFNDLKALYDFHLVKLVKQGQYYVPSERLIPGGIFKSISYKDNYSFQQMFYNGPLWELDPVEVLPRPRPAKHVDPLPDIEMNVLEQALGDRAAIDRLQKHLKTHRLAMVSSRDVTIRGDKQQDYNLKIYGTSKQTAVPGSTPFQIAYAQFFQADLLRGYNAFKAGRRAIGIPMHNGSIPPLPGSPPGSVALAADGSMAAFVPSSRSLSWQLVQPDGKAVVHERYWVTFAPGEMRSCTNCHGVNKTDVVLGQPPPTNPPKALFDLARWYRGVTGNGTIGDTVGAYVPSSGHFTMRNSNTAGPADTSMVVGPYPTNWIAISGDWNGDGLATPGLYDPVAGRFHLFSFSPGGGLTDTSFLFDFANAGLLPIAGDWDRDGVDTIGTYDPATGSFRLRNSNSTGNPDSVFTFGLPGGIPIAGDWDGDGRTTIGVFMKSSAMMWLRNSNTAGPPDLKFAYGVPGADQLPIAGDWDDDGVDTVGLYEPATGTFKLRNSNSAGNPSVTFTYGPAPGSQPIAGDWNGGG